MPSSVIGSLRVALGLDSAEFSAGASRAEKRAEALGFKIGQALRSPISAAGALKGALGALGGALLIKEIGEAVSRGLEYAASLGEVAQQLGVTTKDLQEYRYAATQVGISQETMDKGLAKLTLTMGQARAGVEKPKAAFKELSELLGKDVLKGAQTAGDAIPLIADALAKVRDPASRAALEVSLFGKTGQQLDTLLAGGSAAVNQLRDAAQGLGLVLSDEQIQNADKTADRLAEVKQVLEANIAGAVANNADAILTLANAFATVVVKAGEALQAVQNFNGIMGYRQGNVTAVKTMMATSSGRSALRGEVEGRIEQNSKDRAANRGNRQSYLGGLIQTTTPGDAASQARSDKEFRALVRQRNALLKADRASDVLAAAGSRRPKPVAGAGAGTSDSAAASAANKARAAQERAARQAQQAAAKALQDERRFNSDKARADEDALRAQQDLTVEQAERAAFERQILASQHAARLTEIATDKDLNEAQRAQLTAIEQKTFGYQNALIDRRSEEAAAKEALDLANARNSNEQDILQAQAGQARTAKERRDLELQLLDLQFQHLRAEQNAVLASKASEADKTKAREELTKLDRVEPLARAQVNRQNQGPLASYLDSIPRTAGEINEALQSVEVDGLQGLSNGLADVIAGTRSLGDVFSSVAQQIVADLAKIALEKVIVGALGKALGGDGSGYVSDPTQAAFVAQLTGARAKGGPVLSGKSYMVGERGPEIFTPSAAGKIIANDDMPSTRGFTVNAPLYLTGAVDLATKDEAHRISAAHAQQVRIAISEAQRRRG